MKKYLLFLPFLFFLILSGILLIPVHLCAAIVCEVSSIDEGPPLSVVFSVQDTETGLSRIRASDSANAQVTIPPFTPDTNEPVLVSAARINADEYFSVALLIMSTTGELSTCGYSREPSMDNAPPECAISSENPGPPLSLQIIVQDNDSGLKAVNVSEASNATVSVPDFTPGTTDGLLISAVGSDAGGDFAVTLALEDMAGNIESCRYTRSVQDETPPGFSIITENAGPPKTVVIQVEDVRSGLQSIDVTAAVNASVSIPGFSQGIVSPPVELAVTQVDENQGFNITLEAKDMAGNTATFKYPEDMEDISPPVFTIISENPGPPFSIELAVRDTLRGLASIEQTEAVNATIQIPDFSFGTTDGTIVTIAQIHDNLAFTIAIKAVDADGNEATFRYPATFTQGTRPEFDAVGMDSGNVFNDIFKSMVVENGQDSSGNKINQFSDFQDEYFQNTAGEPFADPCFSALAGDYRSALVSAWSQATFEWQITLQMKPATDLSLGIIACILENAETNVWESARQTGAYSLPAKPGVVFFIPSANPRITVEALPGSAAASGFPQGGFYLDARKQPGMDPSPMVDNLITLASLMEEDLVMILPRTGMVNASGQPVYELNAGDRIHITLSVPPNNTADLRFGRDSLAIKYIGFIGTEQISP
jgi:hypothetical protein